MRSNGFEDAVKQDTAYRIARILESLVPHPAEPIVTRQPLEAITRRHHHLLIQPRSVIHALAPQLARPALRGAYAVWSEGDM